MQQRQALDESDNAPNGFRKQHGQCKAQSIYDQAHHYGVIDDHQHSDMVHFVMMREAFLTRNQPRDTVIGKLADNGGSGECDGRSLSDKYSVFLREVPKVTQETLAALTTPLHPTHTKRMFMQSREIVSTHLALLRAWLDAN